MMTTVVTTTATTATSATAATATTTTVVAVATVQQALALGVVATALLIGLLIVKELLMAYAAEAGARPSWKAAAARFYAANLNVAILPLMLIFGLIVVTKVAEVI